MYKRYQASIKQAASNWVESRWYYWFLALISFVFVLLFSRATSPLYAYVGYDAAIFKQMGMAILKGKTIYLDYFDNKGCLLYFLHALCLWLGGDFVILIFQAISLTVTLIFLDKIISLYKKGANRLYILLAGLVLLLCFYEGGDLTEEWSLPFICYPLYKFLKSYKEDKPLIARDLYYVGLCFGVITFLRINNAVPFCGFLICLFIGCLWKKQWNSFIINILAFIGGIVTIAIPCFLYFYLKAGAEGVYWMVYGTFLSGFDYLGVNVKISVIVAVCYYLLLLIFFVIQYISLSDNKFVGISIILAYILHLLAFGTKCSEHYQGVMVPIYVICLATININNVRLKKCLISLAAVVIIAFLARPFGFLTLETVGKDKFASIYRDFHETIDQIPEYERDSIYNYNTDGLGCELLWHENLIQSNKILYPTLTYWLDYLRNNHIPLSNEKPLWVMISYGKYFPEDMLYLRDNYDERFVFHYDNQHFNGYGNLGIKKNIYFFRRK